MMPTADAAHRIVLSARAGTQLMGRNDGTS